MRAKLYRARAMEIRAIADTISDANAKVQLLKTALDYEAMADSIERIAQTHNPDGSLKTAV